MTALERDLEGGRLDLVWITHQHSDHVGGATRVLERFRVATYVDNGRDADRPMIARVHEAAHARGTNVVVVDPEHPRVPLADAGDVHVSALLPRAFPPACAQNPNDCSIALRIDDCASSVLFPGDAEADEEAAWSPLPVTLLQVGHHGSSTSTTDAFLAATRPSYAVISAGKPDEGTNAAYCHPRAAVVERLSRALGAGRTATMHVFDGDVRCQGAGPDHWHDVGVSDRLWVTARDGDVTLETLGDGHFERR
jgi:competence protein ComEC